MNITLPGKYTALTCLASLFLVFFFFSCKKSMDTGADPNNIPPDLATKIISSVSGFVTNENDAPIAGASVKMGTANSTTDQYGFFEIKNVEVVKNAASVTVSYAGYFKGIKTYMATEGKEAFFRIKLLPKTIAGNISTSTGGSVTLTNGLNISLPANAVKNAATGAAYTGTVTVAAKWIDPTSPELDKIMPGDLRGVNTDGLMKGLTTYGMVAVELTGSAGELLQVADGKKSTITFPVPASILTTAPSTIPLWYFDESTSLWKEEGVATKTGSNYVGEVSHFSFWNCDVPTNFVLFDCTLKDQAGNPLSYTLVKIIVVTSPNISRTAYTDESGYVSGLVPNDAQLSFNVFSSNYNCGLPIYTQLFSTTNAPVSLGTITVVSNITVAVASVTGTVTDCFNNPVTNGRVTVIENNQFTRYFLNGAGSYNFSKLLCNSSSDNIAIVGENLAIQEESSPVNYTLVPGTNNIGNIQACGVSSYQFINFTIDGTTYSCTAPTDSIRHYSSFTFPNQGLVYAVSGSPAGPSVNLGFSDIGIGSNTQQALTRFTTTYISDLETSDILTPVSMTITEYGPVGLFISGNFSGIITGTNNATVNHNISCSFRVRRKF